MIYIVCIILISIDKIDKVKDNRNTTRHRRVFIICTSIEKYHREFLWYLYYDKITLITLM